MAVFAVQTELGRYILGEWKIFTSLNMSKNDQKKCQSIDFRVINDSQVGEFMNTKSMKNED